MKNKTSSFLASCLCFALVGAALAIETPAVDPKTGKSVDTSELVTITKERDEAKAALAANNAAQQQNQIVTEYYKVLAEKNEGLLRLIALSQQLETATKEVATLKAQLDVEKAKVTALAKPEAPRK